MPHIHTAAGQIDHTVTAYIARQPAGEEPRLLLHRHRKLHVLLPIGGHIELDETPWQAVAHEIVEEAGYQLDELKIMQPEARIEYDDRSVVHPQPVIMNTHTFDPLPGHYHCDTAYFFLADNPPIGSPQAGESNDLRWLSREDIAALDSSQIYTDCQQIAVQLLDTFLTAWKPVTASDFSLGLPPTR